METSPIATDHTKVEGSSAIRTVGYNGNTGQLVITFNHSPTSLYLYQGVKPNVYTDFQASASKGTFYNERIKPNFLVSKVDLQDLL